MGNDDFLLEALKSKIFDALSGAADVDLLDYIYKLLIAESR